MRRTSLLLLLAACTQANDLTTDTEPLTASDTESSSDTEVSFDPIAEAARADLEDNDASGVSIAVWHQGQLVYAEAFGSARPGEQLDPDTETLFQIGSTTKMLTAMATLQAVERGELALDDTLEDAWPGNEFARDADWNDQIEVEHLLTHEGAFVDVFDWTAGSEDESLQSWHQDTYLETYWLMAEPGAFWNYANPNFDFAGILVEVHDDDGRAYPDVMIEDVFTPLGMDRTFQRKDDVIADGNYATGRGYRFGANGGTRFGDVEIDDVPDVASARPAGAGTWTTPTQMLSVADFLMNGVGGVVSEEHRAAMTSAQVGLGYGTEGAYGYGVFIDEGLSLGEDEYYETPFWSHGGNTLSYTSIFWMLPEHDFAVSILSSGYGTDFSLTGVAAIEAYLDLGTPTDEPEIELDLERLDEHVGSYYDDYNVGGMTITREGDTLLVSMPLLEALGYEVGEELYTAGSQLFYLQLNGDWYDLTFLDTDGTGESRYARNRSFVVERTDEADSGEAAFTGEPVDEARRARIAQALAESRLPNVPLTLPRPPR